MPGMRPAKPEIVNYQQYEAMRDDGLPPASLTESDAYTYRLRHIEPTLEAYASDCPSVVVSVNHLVLFSIVRFRLYTEAHRILVQVGVNLEGIAYNNQKFNGDPSEVPYEYEVGYFVGERDGIGPPDSVSERDGVEDDEVVVVEQDRRLQFV